MLGKGHGKIDMPPPFLLIVRSLSGKNWQDRDKADKVSISFPASPKDKLKCFWGCNKDI